MNQSIPYPNEGVDSIGVNPDITNAYVQQEYETTQPAVEDSRPAIQPEAYQPDLMSQVVDNTDLHSNTYTPYNVESWEQFEERANREYTDSVMGRTRFSQPPQNSGFKPFLPVEEGRKPTEEQLVEMRRKESVEYLMKQLQTLRVEASNLQLKLSRNSQIQRDIKSRIESLTI